MLVSTPYIQATQERLPGWVSTFYVTSGGKKSGPYHARCWKKNGKLKKEYIKAADLDRVRAACENHRQKRLHYIELSKQFNTVAGNLNFLARILKRSEKRTRIRQEETAHLHRLQSQGPQAPHRPHLRRPRTPKARFPRIHPSSFIPRPSDLPLHPSSFSLQPFMYPLSTKYSRKPRRQVQSSLPTQHSALSSGTPQVPNSAIRYPIFERVPVPSFPTSQHSALSPTKPDPYNLNAKLQALLTVSETTTRSRLADIPKHPLLKPKTNKNAQFFRPNKPTHSPKTPETPEDNTFQTPPQANPNPIFGYRYEDEHDEDLPFWAENKPEFPTLLETHEQAGGPGTSAQN